ncbi:MAG TPA: FAD-dependent oxidoreductase [Rubrivivax sp.]|nr:FAD-dependent oxidoreductase [Rubrivivax sp.]
MSARHPKVDASGAVAFTQPSTVAVIGGGIAGATCAASLQGAGMHVTVFEKARGPGGRMATRRVTVPGADGVAHTLAFDHGAQHITARSPRFRAAMRRAQAAGVVAPWQPRVHSGLPGRVQASGFVALPQMSALCRHLLQGVDVQAQRPVQRLQRSAAGWQVVTGSADKPPVTSGPFDHVMLAMPPAQAAVLLAGHHDGWADALMSVRMDPCWTLMAATDDVDWPWDAAEPGAGPLAWVARNDRKPGRSTPPGIATWVAHATPAWSAEHLEADPRVVAEALRKALQSLLPADRLSARPLRWLHSAAHRWRYALPTAAALDASECWWDAELGLGVCGDYMAGGGVEAAWRSGDELADTVAAWLEERQPEAETV